MYSLIYPLFRAGWRLRLALPSQLWLPDLRVTHIMIFSFLLHVCFSFVFRISLQSIISIICGINMFSAEGSSTYMHRRTPSSSSTLTYSPRDDDDGMVK